MSVGLKVDGLMIVIVAGVVAGSVIYIKRKKIKQALDVTSDKNVFYSNTSDFVRGASSGKYKNVADFTYKTRKYNPLAWAFEVIGKLNGDLP